MHLGPANKSPPGDYVVLATDTGTDAVGADTTDLRTRSPQQGRHLVRRPGSQTRDVAVEDDTDRDQRYQIGEEKLQGGAPEEDWRDESDQRTEKEDRYHAGEGSGLELEDSDGAVLVVSLVFFGIFGHFLFVLGTPERKRGKRKNDRLAQSYPHSPMYSSISSRPARRQSGGKPD